MRGLTATGSVARRCDVCGLLHVSGPFARPCYYDELRAVLGSHAPTERQDRHLRWLAGLDKDTVDAFVSIVLDVRGVVGRP